MPQKRTTLPDNFKDLLKEGNLEQLKQVFEKCDINAKVARGIGYSNALSLYPLPREFAFWLKDQGIDLEYKGRANRTPIFDHVEQFRFGGDAMLLVELGCNIHAITQYGETLMHSAVAFRNIPIIKYLVQQGFEIDLEKQKQSQPNLKGNNYLEILLQHNTSAVALLSLVEPCQLLIEYGVPVTPYCKKYFSHIVKQFEFYKTGMAKDIQKECCKNLETLYQLFDVCPIPERKLHDGISDIIIKGNTEDEMYSNLWNLLVPANGKAQSMQGEAVRIFGKLSHELLDNGGINWNSDFKQMADTLLHYFTCGVPLSLEKMNTATKILSALHTNISEKSLLIVRSLLIEWIKQNCKCLK